MYFFSQALLITGCSIGMSVLVLNISRSRPSRPMPWWLRITLDGWLGHALLLHSLGYESMAAGGGRHGHQNQSPTRTAQEMHDVGGGGGFDGSIGSDGGGGGGRGMAEDGQHIIQTSAAIGEKFGAGPHRVYWAMLATAIDRLWFVCVAGVFAIDAIVCAF